MRVLLLMPLAYRNCCLFPLFSREGRCCCPVGRSRVLSPRDASTGVDASSLGGCSGKYVRFEIRFGDEAREFEFETLKAVTSNSPWWTTAKGRSTSSCYTTAVATIWTLVVDTPCEMLVCCLRVSSDRFAVAKAVKVKYSRDKNTYN